MRPPPTIILYSMATFKEYINWTGIIGAMDASLGCQRLLVQGSTLVTTLKGDRSVIPWALRVTFTIRNSSPCPAPLTAVLEGEPWMPVLNTLRRAEGELVGLQLLACRVRLEEDDVEQLLE